jgi:hypothetical protein
MDALLPRKSAPDSRTHLSFSPNTTIESVCLSQALVDDRLLGLLDPYHQYVIGTFNTCSRGLIHQSLIDTDGGYNLGGTGLPHHTLRPLQPVVSPFHLRAPLGLRLSKYQHKPLTILRVKHLAAE